MVASSIAGTNTSSHPDYFHNRPAARSRPSITAALTGGATPPRSPRTPQLGRSISSQFGSPGAFREQDDIIVYELGARHFSAGFAGESRPRCILPFTPQGARRVGDYRHYDPEYAKAARNSQLREEWGAGYELYTIDLRDLDLGLVEDKLDRALRVAMTDYLQLDTKPRKAVLTLPSLLPVPIVHLALRVLFAHFTQPPSVTLLTHPVMCCVSAGLRHGLVVHVGWEETVVTAVGEYKEVFEKRTIRAGKRLTREVGEMIETAMRSSDLFSEAPTSNVTFAEAEDFMQRLAWCRRRNGDSDADQDRQVQLSVAGSDPPLQFSVPFAKFADPAEETLFAHSDALEDFDDHDLPVDILAYRVLLSLPTDVRAICLSRIIVTGGVSQLPGFKRRLLQEISHVIETRGWDPVSNYGSARSSPGKALREHSINISLRPKAPDEDFPTVALSPMKMPIQESVPHAERVHDDIKDPVTLKAEREAAKGKLDLVNGVVRGVESLGPWAGASLAASLRIKGVHEIEREDFMKHGLRSGATDI